MFNRSKKVKQRIQLKKATALMLALISSVYGCGLPALSAPPAAQQAKGRPQTRVAQRRVLPRRVAPRPLPNLTNKDILLVMPNAGADKDELKDAFKDVHGTVLGSIGKGPLEILIVQTEKGKLQQTERKLNADTKHFKAVSENKAITADYAVSDPDVKSGAAWHLPYMNVPSAWDVGMGTWSQFGQQACIAVLDSGVSWQSDTGITSSWGADVTGVHQNIAKKLLSKMGGLFDTGLFGDDVEDLDKEMEHWANDAHCLSMAITDTNGHGTAVACAAAARANGKAAVGVAPGASIYPIRIADGPFNAMIQADTLSTVAGMIVAIYSGARIVNISYRDMNDKEGLKVLHELFKFYYYKKNGLIFVSAGNDGTVKPWDDCVYLNTVAALQETKATKAGEQPPLKAVDSKATGGGWAASSGKHVDFAAPGLDIAVTNPDGTSTALGGSSFAAPLVAGLAALIISINPRLTNKQVESILVSSCRGVSGRNQQFGFGMPDAEKAVKLAKSM